MASYELSTKVTKASVHQQGSGTRREGSGTLQDAEKIEVGEGSPIEPPARVL